jgi:hypothetical protein
MMKPAPKEVTTRYTNNLMRKGRNDIFELCKLVPQDTELDGLVVGHYFLATVKRSSNGTEETSPGITPLHAVQRALAKHGVTFRKPPYVQSKFS